MQQTVNSQVPKAQLPNAFGNWELVFGSWFADRSNVAMKVNHLNLTVTSPTETSAFLAKYFGLRPQGGNAGIQMLYDDNGMVLTLIKGRADDRDAATAEGAAERVKYPSSFHIGFIQDSQQRVNDINQRLRDDGYDVPLPSHQHGSWTFYFVAPGGFTVEVMG